MGSVVPKWRCCGRRSTRLWASGRSAWRAQKLGNFVFFRVVSKNMESFSNTAAFGRLIAQIRSSGALSLEAVTKSGGPSDRYQSQIEAGSDMTITAETIAKYSTAFRNVKTPEAASLPGFLDALSEAYSASQNDEDVKPLSKLAPVTADGFHLGNQLPRRTPIHAAALVRPERRYAQWFVSQHSNLHTVARATRIIAERHAAPTLVPRSITGLASDLRSATLRIGSWPAVSDIPQGRLDPLHGVTTFEQALHRADALGATGIDRTHLAWAILLANAEGQLWGKPPMERWLAVAAGGSTDSWDAQVKTINSGTAGVPVNLKHVLETAKHYLTTWSEQWFVNLQFASTPRPAQESVTAWKATPTEQAQAGLTWSLTSSPPRALPDETAAVDAGMWLFDDLAMPTLPAVLADMGQHCMVLDEGRGGERLTAPGASGPTYQWCPLSDRGTYGVASADGINWVAVQLG